MCVKVAYVNFNNKRRYDDDDGLIESWTQLLGENRKDKKSMFQHALFLLVSGGSLVDHRSQQTGHCAVLSTRDVSNV